jgi:hypothetical protein
MKPTDKQLSDLWFLVDDYTGNTTVGDRMRLAWDFVERETGNAMYLSQAHNLCHALGIAPGHIEDRMFDALGKLCKLQEVDKAAKNLCKVKGRHHSEQAMLRLMKACDFETPNDKA